MSDYQLEECKTAPRREEHTTAPWSEGAHNNAPKERSAQLRPEVKERTLAP